MSVKDSFFFAVEWILNIVATALLYAFVWLPARALELAFKAYRWNKRRRIAKR